MRSVHQDPNWAVSSPWLVFLFSCKDLLLMKKMKPRPVASDMGMCTECHLERTSITTHHNNYIRERTLLHFQCSLHSGFPEPVFPAWNWLPTKRDSQLKSQKITRQKTHVWPWSIHLKLMFIHKASKMKTIWQLYQAEGLSDLTSKHHLIRVLEWESWESKVSFATIEAGSLEVGKWEVVMLVS